MREHHLAEVLKNAPFGLLVDHLYGDVFKRQPLHLRARAVARGERYERGGGGDYSVSEPLAE